MIGLCGCLCGLTVFGLWRLDGWLAAYDRSRPEFAVAGVTELLGREDWRPLAQYLTPPLSEFEGIGQIRTHFLERGMDFSRMEHRRTGDNRYELWCGEEKLAMLSILRNEAVQGKGFASYSPEELHFLLPPPREYLVTMPRGATLTVNGSQLPEQRFSVQEGAQYRGVTSFDRLSLRMQALYFVPQLSAKLGEQPLDIDKTKDGFAARLRPDDRRIALLSPVVAEGTQKYANYISNDAKFEEVRPFLLQGTVFYNQLSQFYNGWYIEHDSVAVRNLQLADWEQLGDEVYSCGVTFDYIVKKGWREHVYPSSYRVVLLQKEGEQPLILDIQVV